MVWIKFIGPSAFCSSNNIINCVNILTALFDIVKMPSIIGLLNWYFLLIITDYNMIILRYVEIKFYVRIAVLFLNM